MDETVVQVLKEVGRPAQTKSTLWVQRGGPPDACVILYDDIASLSGAVAERLLANHAGYLQNNGYGGYNAWLSPYSTALSNRKTAAVDDARGALSASA